MPRTAAARPLVVTADSDLLDALLRLAGAAGVEVEVACDAGAARRAWADAPLVLVGADVAPAAAAATRRAGVVVVGTDLDDAGVWRRAVAHGAERVVLLPDGEDCVVGLLADTGERAAEGLLVAVVGGRGGAGATTLSVALALAAARRGASTLLVDADPLGGGIDLVLGGEDDAGLRWPDLARTRGRLPGAALAEALPFMSGLAVLSWDRGEVHDLPRAAMEVVLRAATRSHDVVVVDLPRRLDDAARAVLEAAGTTLLVVPAEVRAAVAAGRVAAQVGLHAADLRVVVRGPSPQGLTGAELARALGLPLAGDMRAEKRVELALDRGEPPGRRESGPLAALCDRLVAQLVREHADRDLVARPSLHRAA